MPSAALSAEHGDASGGEVRAARQRQRRTRGRQRRRRLRTTREGKAFIAVTIGVGIAAFNTGNNLMFLILGFMLSLIVLSGILSELVLQNITVSRRLPRQVHAGEVALIEIALRNHKPRAPSYSLEVEDLATHVPSERRCYFLKVAPGVQQLAAYRRTPATRGILSLSGFRVATRYPFGIFEKWRVIDSEEQLLVYPALARQPPLPPPNAATGADRPRPQQGPGTEIDGLRGFRDGDNARSIHWRRSASLGRLVALERRSEASERLCLRIDSARSGPPTEAWNAGFERAISETAAMAVEQVGRGVAVEVLTRSGRSPLADGASAEPVLRYLALLQATSLEEADAMAQPPPGSTVLDVPVVPRPPLSGPGGPS